LEQLNELQSRVLELKNENETLKKELQNAREEIRWLHLGLQKPAAFTKPREAVEAYASALIKRNGALARIYLAEPLRGQMPAHGIGVSNPHLTRYEILGEKKVGKETYEFRVRFYSEYTGQPEAAGEPVTLKVIKSTDDTSNEVWLISERSQ